MPAGLRCWDEDGNLMVDTTTSLARVIGTVETGTSSGIVAVPGFSDGIPWYACMRLEQAATATYLPEITISGMNLSWSFSLSPTYSANALIIYGIR